MKRTNLANYTTTRNEKIKPDALLEIYINEEGEVESCEVLTDFRGGEYRLSNSAQENFSDYDIESYAHLFKNKDTLYHTYVAEQWHKTSYEYEEWDMDIYFLQITEVMSNYRGFLESEEDFNEQLALKDKDNKINIRLEGFNENYGHGWSSSFDSSISFNDIAALIRTNAKHDIRLSHRLAVSHPELQKHLGDLYDEEIVKIEQKRIDFVKYLKYSRDVKMRYTTEGYFIKVQGYMFKKGEMPITYKDIENIPDDILLEYSSEHILKYFIDAKIIMNEFEEDNKEKEKFGDIFAR